MLKCSCIKLPKTEFSQLWHRLAANCEWKANFTKKWIPYETSDINICTVDIEDCLIITFFPRNLYMWFAIIRFLLLQYSIIFFENMNLNKSVWLFKLFHTKTKLDKFVIFFVALIIFKVVAYNNISHTFFHYPRF